jgi:hypothetical protein
MAALRRCAVNLLKASLIGLRPLLRRNRPPNGLGSRKLVSPSSYQTDCRLARAFAVAKGRHPSGRCLLSAVGGRKKALGDKLLLRGPRDFADLAAYRRFVDEVALTPLSAYDELAAVRTETRARL